MIADTWIRPEIVPVEHLFHGRHHQLTVLLYYLAESYGLYLFVDFKDVKITKSHFRPDGWNRVKGNGTFFTYL